MKIQTCKVTLTTFRLLGDKSQERSPKKVEIFHKLFNQEKESGRILLHIFSGNLGHKHTHKQCTYVAPFSSPQNTQQSSIMSKQTKEAPQRIIWETSFLSNSKLHSSTHVFWPALKDFRDDFVVSHFAKTKSLFLLFNQQKLISQIPFALI